MAQKESFKKIKGFGHKNSWVFSFFFLLIDVKRAYLWQECELIKQKCLKSHIKVDKYTYD